MGQTRYYLNGAPTHCQRPDCKAQFTDACFRRETDAGKWRYYCSEVCADLHEEEEQSPKFRGLPM